MYHVSVLCYQDEGDEYALMTSVYNLDVSMVTAMLTQPLSEITINNIYNKHNLTPLQVAVGRLTRFKLDHYTDLPIVSSSSYRHYISPKKRQAMQRENDCKVVDIVTVLLKSGCNPNLGILEHVECIVSPYLFWIDTISWNPPMAGRI